MDIKKNNEKLSKIIEDEIYSDEALSLKSKNDINSNYVVTEGQSVTSAESVKFLSSQKIRDLTVAILYCVFAALIISSFSIVANKQIAISVKNDYPLYELGVMIFLEMAMGFFGVFAIIYLQMDRSLGIDKKAFIFHVINITPLFIGPIYNVSVPVDSIDSFENHILIGSLSIILQGVALALSMIIINNLSKKRFPILAKKTVVFWIPALISYFLPILIWLVASKFDLGEGDAEVLYYGISAGTIIILMAFLFSFAIIWGNRFYIFHDKLVSRSSFTFLMLFSFVFSGAMIGAAYAVIDYKTEFSFNINLIIFILVSLVIVGAHLGYAIFNYKLALVKKSSAITASLVYHVFFWLEFIAAVIMSLFVQPEDTQTRGIYPYFIIVAGVASAIISFVNRFLEIPAFDLNANRKIIALIILSCLLFLFILLINAKIDAAILQSIYSLQISLIVLVIPLLGYLFVIAFDFYIILAAHASKKKNGTSDLDAKKTIGESFKDLEVQKSISKPAKFKQKMATKK